MATTAISTATATARISSSQAKLVENFETFLSLLTTQLKNQDPLSPMDGNQFTQQLVQMTGVEQQLLSNQLLTSLVNQGGDPLSSAVGMIGKEISAARTTAEIENGLAEWGYELPGDAQKATVEVRNAAGQVVNTWNLDETMLEKGRHALAWDGTITKDGVVQADKARTGAYTLTVNAWAGNGKVLTVPVNTVGTVTAVETVDGEPWLSLGSTRVPMSAVTSVRAAAPAAAATQH
jgi:flagellar basal-body rod modification protein FlgD